MSDDTDPVQRDPAGPHVLTLTALYPSTADDAGGCFVAEPLDWLLKLGVRSTVLALQPFYRKKNISITSLKQNRWLRYLAVPGAFGLSSAGAFAFARIVGQVREIHIRQHIDLIHAHSALPCGHAAMLLNKELGIPYVVSVHGLDAFSTVQVPGRAGSWCRRISQRVYSSSRRVICVSERVREEVIAGMGGRCRTSVVYNGVDPEVFTPCDQQATDPLLLLSVGNLIPIKGHEIVVRAVASIAKDVPNLRLKVIGEGPERSRLEALVAKLNLADRVLFAGRTSRSDVAAAMQQCTLFVLPSRYEALGCVYLEAMSSGKPAIGCRGQGIAEIIQHGSNGFLVGPDNEKELALALTMLLRDEPRRKSLGLAARDTILERLTLEHQAETLARIYREVQS